MTYILTGPNYDMTRRPTVRMPAVDLARLQQECAPDTRKTVEIIAVRTIAARIEP